MRADLLPLVQEIAATHKLDFRLVDAIISAESSYLPYALRYEPTCTYDYSYQFYASHTNVTPATELTLQHFSIGLCQIMGFKARELSFIDPFPLLFEPKVNIEIGCRFIAKLKQKYPAIEDQVASYNSGSPIVIPGGGYKNQAYVDRVLGMYRKSL